MYRITGTQYMSLVLLCGQRLVRFAANCLFYAIKVLERSSKTCGCKPAVLEERMGVGKGEKQHAENKKEKVCVQVKNPLAESPIKKQPAVCCQRAVNKPLLLR